ncbi:MAG TPA: DHA2 family efflux MFS transporter permease subunit [Gammaproteobacteria bacterium]|jgi:DHA2 family multidrug resistance protein|nr:DHA2 family efflux MFS transporter permease subunit [Gammaproteobacteria bacterium]
MNFSKPAAGEPHTAMITVAVMLGTLMQVLDTTIANVALPSMQGTLNATQDQVAWVLTSYIVGAAIMTPPTGWLAGRFGRKHIYLISIVGFTIASFLCGIATSLGEIVLFRVMQGVFGAAMVPISQAILLDSYPREKHGMAMAIFGVGIMLGPILGPTLGGWLTDSYSWRWVFFINIPVGLLTVMMVTTYVHETEINRKRTFDALGFVFLSLAIGALQMLLDRGERQDWFGSAEIVIECGLAVSGLWMFLVHATGTEHPYIDLHLFKDRNYVLSTLIGLVVFTTLFAAMSLVPPFAQNLMGYPVVTTGWVLMPRGIGTMISMMLAGRLSQKVDPRFLISSGLLIMAFSLYEISHFDLQVDAWAITWTGFVQGLGMGLCMIPLMAMAFSTLPSALRTEATGVYNLTRNLGGSIGISVAFTLLDRFGQVNHASLAQHITPYNAALANAPLDLTSRHDLASLNAMVSRQAAMISYNNDFKLMMILSLVAIPIVLLLRRPRFDKAQPKEAAPVME